MAKSCKKPVIGILGGIGSGKTYVARQFAKLGCQVINADKIAHQMLGSTEVKNQIIANFGKSILDKNGVINRPKLAKIVFADAQKLEKLNSIIHPPVMARVEQLIEQFRCRNQLEAIVLDVPLLAEVGWVQYCDYVIFVDCEREKRLKRAKNKGISEQELKIREKFQISLDTKAQLADNIIDNNSGFSTVSEQVSEIFSYIKENR